MYPDTVPDQAYHFDADPDPDFYLMRMRIRMRIRVTKMIRIHNTVRDSTRSMPSLRVKDTNVSFFYLYLFCFFKGNVKRAEHGSREFTNAGFHVLRPPHRTFLPRPLICLLGLCTFLRRYPDRKEVGHSDVYHLVLPSRPIANVFTLVFKGSLLFKICKNQNKKNMKRMFQEDHASKIVIVARPRPHIL